MRWRGSVFLSRHAAECRSEARSRLGSEALIRCITGLVVFQSLMGRRVRPNVLGSGGHTAGGALHGPTARV